MTRIFMDPNGARRVSSQMHRIAYDTERFVRQISGMLNQLESVWKGDSPTIYIQTQRSHLSALRSLAQQLHGLASRLEYEIEEYIRVTSHFD